MQIRPAVRHGIASVSAPPPGQAIGPERRRRAALDRRRAQHGVQHFELWQIDAQRPRHQARPGPTGQNNAVAGDRPAFGDHAGDAPVFLLHAADRTSGKQGGPPRPRALGHGGGRPLRFGPGVVGGIERAVGGHIRADQITQGALVQYLDRGLIGGQMRHPAGMPRGPRRVMCKEDATALKPGRVLQPRGIAFPQAHGFGHQGQFARIPQRHTHPAPIAPRLLTRDQSLFEQGDRAAPFRQFQRSRAADDAATDHDGIDAGGQGRVRGDRRGAGSGHGPTMAWERWPVTPKLHRAQPA